ncbi:MAG: sigma 54-interacting transcriptional regulator, partial [Planctomycetes bacterium]|nr:sigma 54-interacting transcriptional regulator [Planctomycetota bacterium]
VSLAQQRGVPLTMVAITLGAGDRRPRGLRRFTTVVREALPASAVLCHLGSGRFQVALPAVTRAESERLLRDAASAWAAIVRQLPENEVEEQPPASVAVQFPDEAPSAEFLFEALRSRLAALTAPGAPALESDELLHRAGVTSVSPAMRTVYDTLQRVAPTDLPILFEGETGVGKEVLTNLVHRWSRRAGGPLIKVHCAALSETLLASELFGHEKGAFTGAERQKIGRFEQADGGTLFLDEVGEIPHDVQVKLLRVLQEGEIDRVGGSKPVKVDVRVIAATNRDMAAMVAQGRFREDLYYRLQGMVVRVPALRERRQELADLAEHFRREMVASGHAVDRQLSTDAMDELYRQEWPGNIRQLRNTVFRAMVLARGDVVQLRDVQAALAGTQPPGPGPVLRVEAAPQADREQPALPAVATPALPSLPTVALPSAPLRSQAPEVVLPRPADATVEGAGSSPAQPEADRAQPAVLQPRLQQLLELVVLRGRYSTREHMDEHGLSHRTALRDLQALVAAGHLVRVGSRRGAFYRPIGADGHLTADGQKMDAP